jgi:hypothetical protein
MNNQPLTYKEDDKYYAVTYSGGHSFYIGSYPNRSAARRRALLAKSQHELCDAYGRHLQREINAMAKELSPAIIIHSPL